MKVRTIVEDRGWKFRLHIKQAQPGQYFAKLAAPDGAAIEHAPISGFWSTIDAAVAAAPETYRLLVCMLEANSAAGASQSFQETTLNHSAEHSARG